MIAYKAVYVVTVLASTIYGEYQRSAGRDSFYVKVDEIETDTRIKNQSVVELLRNLDQELAWALVPGSAIVRADRLQTLMNTLLYKPADQSNPAYLAAKQKILPMLIENKKLADEEDAKAQLSREAHEADALKKLRSDLDAADASFSQSNWPKQVLDARLMVYESGGTFMPIITMREWLSLLKVTGDFEEINLARTFGSSGYGLKVKRRNNPAVTIIWRLDGTDLYVAAMGEGDAVQPISRAERQGSDYNIVSLAIESANIVSKKYQVPYDQILLPTPGAKTEVVLRR